MIPGPTKEQLGPYMRDIRLTLGMTQEQLAVRAGVPVQVVSEIEEGHNPLCFDILSAVSRGLGMTPGTIVRLWERGMVFKAASPA